MPIAQLSGADLSYRLAGAEGDPVALVHGSLVDGSTWERVVPALSRSLQVLSYDRRGCGASSPGVAHGVVRADSEDLATLLETTDHFPAHIVAHSYGGAVALRLAVDRPELVRSLSIHEPPFFGLLSDRPGISDEGAHYLERIPILRQMVERGENTPAAREVVQTFSLTGGAWDRLPAAVQHELSDHMGRWAVEYGDPDALRPPDSAGDILTPVLLTSGERSPPFLRSIRDELARQLANARPQEIAEAGHVPHLSHPDAYVGILLTFLLERNVPVT